MTGKAIHGHSWPVRTRTYTIWKGMRNRCRGLKPADARIYRDRGIAVCARWNAYAAFLEDMGEAPDGMSIDRIDNDKGYSPDNCRWATPLEQSNNSRVVRLVTVGERTQSISAWARELSVTPSALQHRLSRGMPIEQAMTLPRGAK